MIVQEIFYSESENEYNYKYDINIFDEEKKNNINGGNSRPKQIR